MPKIIEASNHYCRPLLDEYLRWAGMERLEGIILQCDCGQQYKLELHPKGEEMLAQGFYDHEISKVWNRYEPPF